MAASGLIVMTEPYRQLAHFSNLCCRTYYINPAKAALDCFLRVYLLLYFFKFMVKFKGSISEILRLLQLNLFEKRPFTELLKPPDKVCNKLISPQLSFWAEL